jgi:dihydrodipicolinate synthase/N-acetylneuraminate lyase
VKRAPSTILATCLVPWDDRNGFDEPCFRSQVRRLAALTRDLYVFGTAGEGYAVSDRQFDEIVTAFLDESEHAAVQPMVGVISLSLATVVDRIERTRERGCRSFQVSLPSWGALADAEVDRFFAETCGRFRDCSFLHYNLARAKRVLVPADYTRLAAAHPNLVAVKYGGRDRLEEYVRAAPELQFFLSEWGYAQLRDRHECGLLVSIGVADLERCRRLFDARGVELRRLAAEAEQQLEALLTAVPEERIDGAYDKMIYKLQDPDFPLRLLPPYEAATAEAFVRFRDAVAAASRRNAG